MAATTTTAASGGSSGLRRRAKAKTIKVGLVTDIGGLNDRSFNFLANKGLEDAEGELGVEGRVLISKSNARLRAEPDARWPSRSTTSSSRSAS